MLFPAASTQHRTIYCVPGCGLGAGLAGDGSGAGICEPGVGEGGAAIPPVAGGRDSISGFGDLSSQAPSAPAATSKAIADSVLMAISFIG